MGIAIYVEDSNFFINSDYALSLSGLPSFIKSLYGISEPYTEEPKTSTECYGEESDF